MPFGSALIKVLKGTKGAEGPKRPSGLEGSLRDGDNYGVQVGPPYIFWPPNIGAVPVATLSKSLMLMNEPGTAPVPGTRSQRIS